jgi:succinate dehydrogenase/fumarate reductase flavoprotein subunit
MCWLSPAAAPECSRPWRRHGARVLLLDKNVIGRGGATIMAQMTCASALGEAEPDNPQLHLDDTLSAGRGLCNENLAAVCTENLIRID